jgi:hypothetical protein
MEEWSNVARDVVLLLRRTPSLVIILVDGIDSWLVGWLFGRLIGWLVI